MNFEGRKLATGEADMIMLSVFKGKTHLVKQGRTIVISVRNWIYSSTPPKQKRAS